MSRTERKRTYHIDDTDYLFKTSAFTHFFDQYRKQENLSVTVAEETFGKLVGAAPETVHGWRFNVNGPVDLEAVKQIAFALGLEDYHTLLREKGNDKTNMESYEIRASLKRIYDVAIEYLDDYETSCGFQNHWEEYAAAHPEDKYPDIFILATASDKLHKVEVALLKEYPILHKLDIYGELDDFISGDLYSIYDDKVRYPQQYSEDIAFNNHCEYDQIAYDAYRACLDKLNEMMDRYF